MPPDTTIDHVTPTCSETLCRQFLAIARNQQTGTLVVTAADGATKSFLCHGGAVVDIDAQRPHGLLTEAILSSATIPPRHLKRAQKLAEKDGTSIGVALLQLGLADEHALPRHLEALVADEVAEVFTWDVGSVHFAQHSPQETLEGFDSELSDCFELHGDPEDLFIEACHRLGAWSLIERHFDVLLDVYYATPGTFHYFREPDVYPVETRVLGATDGTRDVAEVIASSELDPFVALKMIRSFIAGGEIELINPVQMFQLGTELATEGLLEKAVKLFQRARERGLNDFDLELRLAEAHDRLGRNRDAAKWYLEFSSSCLAKLRVDEAESALRRVVRLCPDHESAHSKLFEIYVQQRRGKEAYDAALKISALRVSRGANRAALDPLLTVRNLVDSDLRLSERIVELAEACGEPAVAQEERARLARILDDQQDARRALEAYQSMFCSGNDSLEVRMKLVELHHRQGNQRKAIEHIGSALALGGKKKIKDPEVLRRLHELLHELAPADARSCRWLVDDATARGDESRAIEVLRARADELERQEEHGALVETLEELIRLDKDPARRWTLASALEKLGRTEEARRELRSLANLSIRRKEFDEARRTIEHVLASSPLDVPSRRAQVELLEAMGDTQGALDELEELALLEILSGRMQEAEEHCRRLASERPSAAPVIERYASLCLDRGDEPKGLEQLLCAARLHVRADNRGLARAALDRLLEIDSSLREASELRRSLDDAETRVAPEPTSPAAPPTLESRRPTSEPAASPAASGVTVRKGVAGITARLKGLQSGGEPAPRKTAKLGAAASRLRALQRGATEETSGPTGDEPTSDGPQVPEENLGERETANGASSDTTADERRETVAPLGGTVRGTKLHSAAARLRALASGGAASPESDPSPTAADLVSDDDTPPASPDAERPAPGEGADSAAPGDAPETARVQQSLGGAANRLAALRKKKG